MAATPNASAPAGPAHVLFREEVLATVRGRLHGAPLQLCRVGPSWPVVSLGLLCVALPVFLALARYTRGAEVSGTLVPRDGLLRLSSAQSGIVLERRVGEGEAVAADAVLFTLGAERNGATHGSAEAQVAASMQSRRDSLAAELQRLEAQARQRALAWQRDRTHWQQDQQRSEQQHSLQSRRVQLAASLAGRYAQLLAHGVVSLVQRQQVESDLLDQQQRLADLERADAARLQAQREAERQQRELGWQADRALAAVRRELAQLDESRIEVELRRAWQVRAPRAGVVSAVLAEPGQAIAAGQSLASLVPANAPLEAELLAPSRAAGLLRPGQAVQLRYQAFPYQKFGLQRGTVREVSAVALPADARGEPLYRVRVSLASQVMLSQGRPIALSPGALVDARVLLERRRLAEWLLEPVLGLRGRL